MKLIIIAKIKSPLLCQIENGYLGNSHGARVLLTFVDILLDETGKYVWPIFGARQIVYLW